MAVGGDAERRHGIILSKTEEAKRAGVKTGMALWEARRMCPELIIPPAALDRYLYFTREVQNIYADYTDRREPSAWTRAGWTLRAVWRCATARAPRRRYGDGCIGNWG